MSYPGNFLKITWGGKSTKDDIWSNSINIRDLGNPDHQGTFGGSLNLQELFTHLQNMYCTNSGMTQYCTLDYVKIAQIGTDGRYIGDARIYAPATGPQGGSTGYNRAPQDSLVLTLTTATRTGLARNGRIYLPAGFVSVNQATGRVDPASAKAAMDQFADVVKWIEDQGDSSANPTLVVASGQGAGAFKIVEGLRVGDVLDTQRRRRNRISEKYQTESLRAV